MVNKNKFSVRNTRKVLRKTGKQWITVSVVLLGLLGLGSAAGATTHAATNAPQANVTKQVKTSNPNNANTNANSNNNWRRYHSKMFVANNGYGIYKDSWQKAGNTSRQFHRDFNVNGAMKDGNNTYYKLYNGRHYVGYTNSHAMIKNNQTAYLNVPYVSQWRPISAPEGCAEASLEMLLRTDHKHVSLRYLYNHLPQSYQMKGGQAGNAYGTSGFSHVIKAYALKKYANRFDKNIKNISGASVNNIKMYVQSGHPVLFYGYSSYQLPGDPNRNHCKVITAYKNGEFRVYDPLYFSKYGEAGTQGRNMLFDRGARFWYSLKQFANEYAHINGSNKKSALVLMGKPHYAHSARRVTRHHVTRRSRGRRVVRRRGQRTHKVAKSKYAPLSHYSKAERSLANAKFNVAYKEGRSTKVGRETMASDKRIDAGDPFNKVNYEKEYLTALHDPYLIIGAQDQLGGVPSGLKDGLTDYGQFAGFNAAKRYAKQHHESNEWLKNNLAENNRHGFYYWFFNGFNDVNGGDASNAAKAADHQAGLTAYKDGLHTSMSAKKHAKPSRAMMKFTMHHLGNTILSSAFQRLF